MVLEVDLLARLGPERAERVFVECKAHRATACAEVCEVLGKAV